MEGDLRHGWAAPVSVTPMGHRAHSDSDEDFFGGMSVRLDIQGGRYT